MKHRDLHRALIILTLLALFLSACGTSNPTLTLAPLTNTLVPFTQTPVSTLTPTTKPTRTPVPPTATPQLTSTLAPAFIFTTDDGATVNVAATMLALVLPLPGGFSGEIKKDNAIIGIGLGSGEDRTREITEGTTSVAQEPTDIVMTWGGESPFFGVAYSDKGLEIPIFLDPVTGAATNGWKEGFLSMVQNGRKILLKGTLRMPVVDPNSKEVKYALEYQFGEGASIVWDESSRQLIWSNMSVTRKSPNP